MITLRKLIIQFTKHKQIRYQQAVYYYRKKKFRISHKILHEILQYDKLQQNPSPLLFNVLNLQAFIHRMTQNANQLNRYQDAANYLQKLYQLNSRNDQNIQNLIVQQLNVNLNKAIKLSCQMIEKGHKKDNFLFYLGVFFKSQLALHLKGNFAQAKSKYRQLLIEYPQNKFVPFALNNLAVACWWHKHPNYRDDYALEEQIETIDQFQYPSLLIDEDFKQAFFFFKKSIKQFQSFADLKDKQKLYLIFNESEIVSQQAMQIDINNIHTLKNQHIGTILMNMMEYLLATDKSKNKQAMFWLKFAVLHYKTTRPQNMDRCFIILALIAESTGQFSKAQKLFLKTLELIEDELNFNKVVCLQRYGAMLKRIPGRLQQGEGLIQYSYELSEQFPLWANKMQCVCIPQLRLQIYVQ